MFCRYILLFLTVIIVISVAVAVSFCTCLSLFARVLLLLIDAVFVYIFLSEYFTRNVLVISSTVATADSRVQELCESRGGRPWLFRLNEPYGFRGRKAILNRASALVTICP